MARNIRMREFLAFLHEDTDNIFNNKYALHFPSTLELLPSEIIAIIAQYLPSGYLFALRSLGNRSISNAIDHVFANVFFSHRRCRTTSASVTRLEALSRTRFATRIRILEIHIIFDCRLPDFGPVMQVPCVVAAISTSEMTTKFESIFSRLPNLKNFLLRAPSGLGGMCDMLHQDVLPLHGAPTIHLDLRFHSMFPYNRHAPLHGHIIDTRSIAYLGYAVVHSLWNLKQPLESFNVLGFADSMWQSKLTSSLIFLHLGLRVPALRNLTILKLQLEMWTFGSNVHMIALVKLLDSSVHLEYLHLSPGPRSLQQWRQRSENWAPLLRLLGHKPAFRLRALELNGLVTSINAPTLAQIINVHSLSLCRLLLTRTNFHYPNTVREFFTACANSSIQYYRSEGFWFHKRGMLGCSSLESHIMERDEGERLHQDLDCWDLDEGAINHCDLLDTTCHGWVEVGLQIRSGILVGDNENGQHGNGYLYEGFMSVVNMVTDGALIDS